MQLPTTNPIKLSSKNHDSISLQLIVEKWGVDLPKISGKRQIAIRQSI